MTRKDYIIIAAVFKRQLDVLRTVTALEEDDRIVAVEQTAKHMADELKYDNSRFDHDRFLTACGITKEIA